MRHTKKILRNKIIPFKKIYKFYLDHFLIGIIVFLINIKNAIIRSEQIFLSLFLIIYYHSQNKKNEHDIHYII